MSFQTIGLDKAGPLKSAYGTLLETIQNLLGIDPVIIVNLGLVLAAISTFLHYAGGSIYRYAQKVCLSSVHINEDDMLYQYVMRWMTDHQLDTKSFRSVKATTPQKSSWEDEEDATKTIDQNFKIDHLISYRTIIGRMPIKLQPFENSHIFRYKANWILFRHQIHRPNPIFQDPRERGYIHLECLGRSLAPLRLLLQEMQSYNIEKSMSTINVFRAISHPNVTRWQKVISRPSRDIRTVILDKTKKQDLLQDINEYLHPRTRRWYANHGIPYRRGYLFSGAPGTGKTSLTSALAGVFGLDIYVLSLLDPSLNESQLMRLLSEVPSRCIVLLEDVDAAGLGKRSNISGKRDLKNKKNSLAPTPDLVASAAQPGVPPPKTEISLSGLLNAIDGVSSHEGRILIMTTNSPDDLDKALIRPGRVDMHIAFELPSHAEIYELFLSMYADFGTSDATATITTAKTATIMTTPPSPPLTPKDADSKEGSKPVTEKAPQILSAVAKSGKQDIKLEYQPSAELETLGRQFAAFLPEGKLSLASIQGFLLQYKNRPKEACENVGRWCEDVMREEEEEEEEAAKV